MNVLIDYLSFTDYGLLIDEYTHLLNLKDVDWMLGRARYGWTEHLYYNGIHIYKGGRDDFCIEMSGIGCRCLETLNGNDISWFHILQYITESKEAHISRLDVACDEQEGILKMDTMQSHCKHKKYICRAHQVWWSDGSEQQIVCGSPKSDTRLRIYNKALERGVEGHWIRAEFQLRDDSAKSFVLNLMLKGSVGETYSGVLLNYLRFVTEEVNDTNYLRKKTTRWWSDFVQTSERIKNIYVGGLEYNLDNVYNYIKIQCSSSLLTYVRANGKDINVLAPIIDAAHLNDRQKQLLSRNDNTPRCI